MTQEYMEQHDWRSGKLQQMINSEKKEDRNGEGILFRESPTKRT